MSADNLTSASSCITYGRETDAWSGFDAFIAQSVLDHGAKTVCELGGGANPTLTPDFVARNGLDYIIVDVSQDELDKAPSQYRKVCADVAGEEAVSGNYDLAFSKMLAEHVTDGARFHRNTWHLLRPGGIAIHFFPTLFALPFIINRILPERLAETLLYHVQAGREKAGRRGKFPAYYHWCRGPCPAQISRLERVGFAIIEYAGFFGHAGYYDRVPRLHKLHNQLADFLVRHPNCHLTSFSRVVLRKQA